MSRVTFELEPTAPFRLDLTVWALRRRPDNLLDCWNGQTYRRVLMLRERPVAISANQVGPPGTTRLNVTASVDGPMPDLESAVADMQERVLGLRLDLSDFLPARPAGCLARASVFRGLTPRFPTLFEALGKRHRLPAGHTHIGHPAAEPAGGEIRARNS